MIFANILPSGRSPSFCASQGNMDSRDEPWSYCVRERDSLQDSPAETVQAFSSTGADLGHDLDHKVVLDLRASKSVCNMLQSVRKFWAGDDERGDVHQRWPGRAESCGPPSASWPTPPSRRAA